MEKTPQFPDVRDWLPSWIGNLGVAVWVSDPCGAIVFMNSEAEVLMGRSAPRSEGAPCHRIVRGTNDCGVPLCRSFCAVRMLATNHTKLEPVRMRVPGAGGRWVEVLIISLTAPDGSFPWLVHLATDAERVHRFEKYLTSVATRTPTRIEEGAQAKLSARENEVLELLAQDQDLYSIASQLFVSYVTIRNHVQHILKKLGVHSIEEAVARHLLQEAA